MSAASQRIAQVRNVLRTQWDPIGVAGVARARDEYDTYAPAVAGMLMRNETAESIAAHLLHIERNLMGLAGDEARAVRVARALLALRG